MNESSDEYAKLKGNKVEKTRTCSPGQSRSNKLGGCHVNAQLSGCPKWQTDDSDLSELSDVAHCGSCTGS